MAGSNTTSFLQQTPTASSKKDYYLNGKLLLCTLIVLFFVVILLCFIRSWIFNRLLRRRIEAQSLPSANVAIRCPLNLAFLPSFVYEAAGVFPPALECPVCLSEFEDQDRGRVLPKCGHAFHLECVDMWLRSHSTCPLCRAPVETVNCPAAIKAQELETIRVISEQEVSS